MSQDEVRRHYITFRFHTDSLNLHTWVSTLLLIHGKDKEEGDDGNKDLGSDEREKQFTQLLQVIYCLYNQQYITYSNMQKEM